VFVPVVDAHVTVQVEHAQRLGLGLYPALREALLERGRQAAQAHLVELAAQGLDLRRAVQTEQQPELARRAALQLLGIAPAQQTHEDQGQQDPTQTVEAVAQATEHTLRDLQQPLSAAQATTARRALRRPLGRRGPPPAPAADSWAGGPCAA